MEDYILNHLHHISFALTVVLAIIGFVFYNDKKNELKRTNELHKHVAAKYESRLEGLQGVYNKALERITLLEVNKKEQRAANDHLTSQLANSCTFTLIRNTAPITNADKEYYKLSKFSEHYLFTDAEVEQARKRALNNPEDTAASSPPSHSNERMDKEGLGVVEPAQ